MYAPSPTFVGAGVGVGGREVVDKVSINLKHDLSMYV